MPTPSSPNPSSPASSGGEAPVYQVSELAEILRGLLEDSLPSVWVEGEISNFSRPASGHWYFTLKDGSAQLRCAMFKAKNFVVRPAPRDGDTVRVRGVVSLYAGRGELQLVCEAMELAGEGALLAAFERLKKKLAAEGLFDPARKRPLPALVRRLGLITSGTGAALQDVRATLARRFPLIEVWLLAVPVQGGEAPAAIVAALRALPALAPVEAILLVRGGGSLEDLMAFNDETVVRAVAACTVPVVCGVGHEVDFSLADFAADLRAPTPTAAAEAVTPDVRALLARAEAGAQTLGNAAQLALLNAQRQLQQLQRRLQTQSPQRRLQEQAQRLDDLSLRLGQSAPTALLRATNRVAPLAARLHAGFATRVDQARARLDRQRATLDALNPSAVLGRGYAIALKADGHAVRDSAELHLGERLQMRFAKGQAETVVTSFVT